MRSNTSQRRQAILTLIQARPVCTQEELVAGLEKHGFDASQASVSRDIRALGLVKASGRYTQSLVGAPLTDPLEEKLRARVLSVTEAGPNLIVLKTTLGEASGVALALDRNDLPQVIGTIAGDDTVFIATPNQPAAKQLAQKLLKLSGVV
ncbi:MAG: hypothetical protein A2289_17495 [Deltaproteobacteria bacterium RIFOXYA12_FULL_58_15]|nr:MAG: hypothetical protein A2289_17495 [Deltaproteobacteria bacterium RIFOXYA12_FULL_58_15]OGR15237.1 MAG: hypothetical protein A2341_09085 [Deltaproteobacteria bacterium RIFOXYB12_FULL_58_9]